MAEIIALEDAAAQFDRDRRAFRLRLAGVSVGRIAEELGCAADQVEASLVRMCGGVSPEMRRRTIRLELERLDELQKAHYAAAAQGGVAATAVILKIMERRARMLGLDAPPTGDPLADAMAARETTTDRIAAAIERIAAEREPAAVIEAEIVDDNKGG